MKKGFVRIRNTAKKIDSAAGMLAGTAAPCARRASATPAPPKNTWKTSTSLAPTSTSASSARSHSGSGTSSTCTSPRCTSDFDLPASMLFFVVIVLLCCQFLIKLCSSLAFFYLFIYFMNSLLPLPHCFCFKKH